MPPAQPRPDAVAGLSNQWLDEHAGDGRGQPQDGQGIGVCPQVAVNGAHVGHLQSPAELDAEEAEAHVPDLPERKTRFLHDGFFGLKFRACDNIVDRKVQGFIPACLCCPPFTPSARACGLIHRKSSGSAGGLMKFDSSGVCDWWMASGL